MPAYLDESCSDDEFLDRLFELAVDRLEDGLSPLPPEVAPTRPHLCEGIARVVRVAQAVVAPQPADLPSLRDYTLVRELGRGGMGSVYLARQERLGRLVALKIMPRAAAFSARARARFLSEAQAIANLHHPNIVAIHDVIEDAGVFAYAMEWVDGYTLADAIQGAADARVGRGATDGCPFQTADTRVGRHIDLDPASVARLGVAVARALTAVHAAGLVHRDVKPSNVLLRDDRTPLLSDFGLVRAADSTDLTQTGEFLGTLAYAAPEQLRGDSDRIDARSDVYALGATLYHALAGKPPFVTSALRGGRRRPQGANATTLPAHSPAEMTRRIEAGWTTPIRRQNPLVPHDFETIIAKAMDRDPLRRYQSAGEMADDLERMLTLRPIHARKAGVFARTIKLARRHRGALAASVLGAVAALGLAVAVVIYVFLVPRWIDAHVREARLILLHPDQANEIVSLTYTGESRTLAAQEAAAARPVFERARREYDAALRFTPFDEPLKQERRVITMVVEGRVAVWTDARSEGLYAYLTFDHARAIDAWSRWEQERDPLAPADPMVAAALGVLYLADDQRARAYPRLDAACAALPNVGFLTVYLADAALQCGDVNRAEHLLNRARPMPLHDPEGALERVTADLLAATGRDVEADAAYRAHPHVMGYGVGSAAFNYARFLESRGRAAEALELRAAVAVRYTHGTKPARAFVRAMERWWAAMPAAARWARIRAALTEDPTNPNSLVGLLGQYVRSRVLLTSAPSR